MGFGVFTMIPTCGSIRLGMLGILLLGVIKFGTLLKVNYYDPLQCTLYT